MTYIWTDEGWLYLAVVLDLFNREVVGWSIKPRMTADIVIDALTMAWFRRKPAPGLIHHSDRGSQYASHAFQARLKEYGMVCSMSRKGNCWDNAPTESFFNSLKNERVHGTRYRTRAEAEADLFDYIEPFYNRRRSHSTLGYASPQQFLKNWISSQHEQRIGGIMPLGWKTKNRGKLTDRDFKTELRSSDRATSKKGLLNKATAFMERLVKTPERVMAYFKHSAVQYAAFSSI